ncbi:MAG: thioredoxin-disulfide reductase [Dehalococcoidia bacterium]
MEDYEVIIIGGGPAGLTAGLYTARAHLHTVLLEAKIPSGQMAMAETIENYPGFPDGIPGVELVDRFTKQAMRFGLQILQYTNVEGVELRDGRKIVTARERKFSAAALIVASGVRWNKLGVPGEVQLANRGVSYCATCDGAFFEDLDVAVIGGGDTAVEDALYLAKIARKVFLIHRRDQLRAQKILQNRALKNHKIETLWSTVLREIRGEDLVESVVLENLKDSSTQELGVSGVFIAVGQRPNVNYLRGLVDMDKAGYIVTDENCATSVPGIFAPGDVRKKALRQISTAVGDGALAAFGAERYIEMQNC